MLRYKGGLDNHPMATKFAQLYRLMSIYSLVKPPKESNVEGGEICHILLSEATKVKANSRDQKKKILDRITDILDDEEFDLNIQFVVADEENYNDVNDAIVGRMTGFIAKTAIKRWCKGCSSCQNNLTSTDCTLPHNLLIYYESYGYLHYLSTELFTLIKILENEILGALHEGLNEDTMINVMDKLAHSKIKLPKVGCHKHKYELAFYVTCNLASEKATLVKRLYNQYNQ
jgi:hypothetical protein